MLTTDTIQNNHQTISPNKNIPPIRKLYRLINHIILVEEDILKIEKNIKKYYLWETKKRETDNLSH